MACVLCCVARFWLFVVIRWVWILKGNDWFTNCSCLLPTPPLPHPYKKREEKGVCFREAFELGPCIYPKGMDFEVLTYNQNRHLGHWQCLLTFFRKTAMLPQIRSIHRTGKRTHQNLFGGLCTLDGHGRSDARKMELAKYLWWLHDEYGFSMARDGYGVSGDFQNESYLQRLSETLPMSTTIITIFPLMTKKMT